MALKTMLVIVCGRVQLLRGRAGAVGVLPPPVLREHGHGNDSQ
jgi:hypothetical protein